MKNFNGENIEKLKKEAFKTIDDNLQKDLTKLSDDQKKQENKRLNDYLIELGNKKKEIQNNPKIDERFKKGILDQIDQQIIQAQTKLETLRK